MSTSRFNDERKDDAYYMKKIQELVNEKLALFAEKLSLEKFITNELNGSELQTVIKGYLYLSASDLNRLYMPFKRVDTHGFLTEDERKIVNALKVNQDCPKMGIEVGLLGPTLKMYEKTIELKTIWDTPKTPNYVLTTNWCNFVKDHKDVLKEGSGVMVWSFRIGHQLCFAITCKGHELPNVEEIHDSENDNAAA